MPRKKATTPQSTQGAPPAASPAAAPATAVADDRAGAMQPQPAEAREPATTAKEPPAVTASAATSGPARATESTGKAGPATDEKGWSTPYVPVFACREKGFELGENRRYKQRVFVFSEKPGDDIRAKLRENGFVYRATEKAWTIPANAETRVLSDRLAREFAGAAQGLTR